MTCLSGSLQSVAAGEIRWHRWFGCLIGDLAGLDAQQPGEVHQSMITRENLGRAGTIYASRPSPAPSDQSSS